MFVSVELIVTVLAASFLTILTFVPAVIIPAATSASSDLTLSIPIDSWDDDIVEKTLTAEYENFFLQIDGYRDKGPDKSWATVDDGLTSVSSDNVVEITIIDNDNKKIVNTLLNLSKKVF